VRRRVELLERDLVGDLRRRDLQNQHHTVDDLSVGGGGAVRPVPLEHLSRLDDDARLHHLVRQVELHIRRQAQVVPALGGVGRQVEVDVVQLLQRVAVLEGQHERVVEALDLHDVLVQVDRRTHGGLVADHAGTLGGGLGHVLLGLLLADVAADHGVTTSRGRDAVGHHLVVADQLRLVLRRVEGVDRRVARVALGRVGRVRAESITRLQGDVVDLSVLGRSVAVGDGVVRLHTQIHRVLVVDTVININKVGLLIGMLIVN
jgi:hypothetical protein